MWLALVLGVDDFALSCCGRGSIKSARLKYHTAGQDVQHKGLRDVLQGEHYDHSHFWLRNLGKYNFPSLTRLLQMLYTQDCYIPSFSGEYARPSSLDEIRLCRELGLPAHPQRTWRLLQGLVGVPWVYLLEIGKSLVSFLGSKVSPLKLAYPCGMLKSWLSLLVAKLGYQSYSFQLNRVVCPYLILPQTGVGYKP